VSVGVVLCNSKKQNTKGQPNYSFLVQQKGDGLSQKKKRWHPLNLKNQLKNLQNSLLLKQVGFSH
jgi:hypothetical protein